MDWEVVKNEIRAGALTLTNFPHGGGEELAAAYVLSVLADALEAGLEEE